MDWSPRTKSAVRTIWIISACIFALPICLSFTMLALHVLFLLPLFFLVSQFGTLNGIWYDFLAVLPVVLYMLGNGIVANMEKDGEELIGLDGVCIIAAIEAVVGLLIFYW